MSSRAGKGGAAPRATATRGIVGKAGKMKYFSPPKGASATRSLTPPASEGPSAITSGAPPLPPPPGAAARRCCGLPSISCSKSPTVLLAL